MHKLKGQGILLFGFFYLLCLAFFLPTITKPFLSDDYDVVYRVGVQKQFFIEGFFRPLSDLTIYFCYWLAGLNATVYNLFNLLVHAASCFVLYRFCLISSLFAPDQKKFVAWAASLLFLIYPFHAESVLWMVGRASSISNFFGFLTLLIAFLNKPALWRYVGICSCYFIGLASYETIFPLPLILLLLLYQPKKPLATYLPLIAWTSVTLILHLLLRAWYAKSLAGQYGQKIFSPSLSTYAVNLFKVTGRLLLPPSGNSKLLAVLFCFVALLLILISFRLLQRAKKQRLNFFKLLLALLVSCMIPAMFGISTHTSEGDRLLYFSSFFFILWLCFVLSLFQRRWLRYSSFAFVALYFFCYMVQSNQAWVTAGRITRQVMQQVKAQKQDKSTFGLINLPEEHNGAFIFRVGFRQALLMNGVDTTGVTVLRTMASEEAAHWQPFIQPQRQGPVLFIPPNTYLKEDSAIVVIRPYVQDTVLFKKGNFQKIVYWNKNKLVPL